MLCCYINKKLSSERQIFEHFEMDFHGKFLFSLRIFARNLLRGNHRFVRMTNMEYEPGFYILQPNTLPTILRRIPGEREYFLNRTLQPFSRDYNPTYHKSYVVLLIMSGGVNNL